MYVYTFCISLSYWLGKIHSPSQPPVSSARKGNSKFEILLLKIFSLKQKTKLNTSSSYRKNQIFTFQENSLWFL